MTLNVFQRHVVDAAGNVLPGASVTVLDQVTAQLVQLYSDSDGATAVGNPISTDVDGFVRFYVQPGRYQVTAVLGGESRIWEDVSLGIDEDISKYRIVGDGVTDDSSSIQSALNSIITRAVFPRGVIYAIESTVTIPDGLDVDFNGSTLRKTVSDTSSAAQVSIGSGATIRNLTLEIPTGVTINRGVSLSGAGARAYNVKVTSVDQQANTANNFHGAFRVAAADTEVIGVEIENFDYAFFAFNGDDGRWENIKVSSYVKASEVEDCNRFTFSNFTCHTKSVNGFTNPGHQGILIQDSQFGKFSNIDIRDCGEHGVRIGGDGDGSTNLSFSNIHTSRTGQCGFKIAGTSRTKDISVSGLMVLDCHWGNAPGSNEDGLRIENADRVHVTGFSVGVRDSTDGSCYDGIYINDSTHVTIVAPNIADVWNNGININDNSIAGTFDNIYIVSPNIDGAGENGINIDVDTTGSELRHIVISDAYINAATEYSVFIDSTDTVVLQPVSISGIINTIGTGVFNNFANVIDPLLNVNLRRASRFETATGTFTASVFIEHTVIDSSAGAVAVTLGNVNNGVAAGTRKIFTMSDATASSTVSVTSHFTSDPEVFTFAETTDVLVLEWLGSKWRTVFNNGVVV